MKKKPTSLPNTIPLAPELATKAHKGTPQYGEFGELSTVPTPVQPLDKRAEGGNVFDLRNEQTTL